MLRLWRIGYDAFWRFVDDDGWALASHVALSSLMALFPFLIFVTALAGFFGSKDLADEAVRIILEAWPQQVATPIAREIHNVLTHVRTDVLTVGVALALYFASNGVESLRIGLNRAYSVKETRPWYFLRLESIGYVLVGSMAMLAVSFLVVLGPLAWATAVRFAPALEPLGWTVTFIRLAAAASVLIMTLIVVHLWLPAGRRTTGDVWPGIVVTLLLWLGAGAAFGRYLAEFASNYVTTYAGLASVMIALAFLYFAAAIFVYGGELNSVIEEERRGLR
ncbi:YihY/virulence factor BrkB family protein [Blastochloris sulfoviridis]|uniref:YihY/virulence factor BrkB family protein n=1 Tax=Blastochloris sulfoviridis TaxID=50712 RepID=A0A5M6I547_9HYPH|nr:YihY/virulence factor BrkB family protein [Blastochloris sulfoviridis]KAA5603366.1 YihY/virulence factor BrkB family protein [Blastochloris sulfoviridis]